ncbi:MAG: transglycosylase SLT domain-containing protein [Gammaproteobacteria bacterium]|nr:transglycosylase SLT domain-containing protein [Gammaproteobacteria bacterium]
MTSHRIATLLAGLCVVFAAHAAPKAGVSPPFQKLLRFDAVTQIAWGERYEHGEGVARDFGKAVQLYCAAARQGNPRAQYRLGWMYANGRGVARDDGLAAAWFKLAADKGDEHAARMLPHLTAPKRPVQARCVAPQLPPLRPVLLAARLDLNSPHRKSVADTVKRMADRYGLDPHLVLAVIQAESAFDPRAVSPKGAMGVMQLMPGTAERFGVRDPFDVEDNLKGGMSYLRWLLAQFDGSVVHAVAAYNAGEEAVSRYGGVPPYEETRTYVQRVTSYYPHLTHPVGDGGRVARRAPGPGGDS